MRLKKFLLGLVFLVIFASLATATTMTYGPSYYLKNKQMVMSGSTSTDPLYLFMNEVQTDLTNTPSMTSVKILEGGTTPVKYTKFQGGDQTADLTYTLPTADGSNGQVLSTNGSGALSWASAGAGTFTGGSITSDCTLSDGVDIMSSTTTAQAATIKVRDVDASAYVNVLSWTNGNTPAVVLGNAADSLSIASTGLNVSTAGALTGVASVAASGAVSAGTTITVGTGGAIFSGGAVIDNATDSEVSITEAGEDLSLDMDSGTNIIGLKSSTGVNGIAMGTVDDLSGIGTLAFDAAASTITLAADGANDDLTIQVTGAQDTHLVFSAAGTSEDALQLTTTAGGINITNGGAAGGEDIDVVSTSASINLTAGEGAADAIVLNASTAAGGIDIISNADIDITTTGAAGEDIGIVNTGGSILVQATESATDSVKIESTAGGIQIYASGASATEDIDIVATGSSINLSSTENAAAAIALLTNGGSSETITVTNTQGTDPAAIKLLSSAGGVTVQAVGATAGDVALNAGDDIILTNVGLIRLDGVATQKIEVEGTANNFEAWLQFTDPTVDANYVVPVVAAEGSYAIALSTLVTNAPDVANSFWGGTNELRFEGSTADSNEHIFAFTEPGPTVTDPTYTFPGKTGTVLLSTSAIRTSQQYVQNIAHAKLGSSGAGWALDAASNVSLATLANSQTAENIVIPITIPLKVGWTITAYTINGQIDSAGTTATLDADLRKHTEATAGYTDASVDGTGAMTQLSKTADYKVVDGKGSLTEVVAADESYYLLVTATTGADCDIEIASITVTVSEL